MPPASTDPIKHVIVLILENRSFDHMLGGLSAAIPDLDSLPKAGEPQRSNRADGRAYKQTDGASRSIKYDPMHELENTLHQLAKDNSGFVADFAVKYPLSQPTDRAEIIKCFADDAMERLEEFLGQQKTANAQSNAPTS
jgi:phospholipase C